MRPSALAVLRLITSSYLVGALHRQIGRLLALEDAVDVAGRAPVLAGDVGPVGDQPAARHEVAIRRKPWVVDAAPQARRSDRGE